MSATTRREALGAATAGAALLGLPGRASAAAPSTIVPVKQIVVRRGIAVAASRDGRTLAVAHERRRSIAIVGRGGSAYRVVDIDGQPVDLAFSPDAKLLAVTTAVWDEPGVVLVDPRTATRLRRLPAGPAPGQVAFTRDGKRLVVAGGEQEGTLHLLDGQGTALLKRYRVGLVPRGLALASDGRTAWVALNAEEAVVRIDLRTGKHLKRLTTPPLPDRIGLSPDGKRLLISHARPDATHVTELDLRKGTVKRLAAGELPAAVGYTRRGKRLAVVGGTGEVVVLGARPRRRRAGGAPRGLAIVGERAFVVDHLTGRVHRVKP